MTRAYYRQHLSLPLRRKRYNVHQIGPNDVDEARRLLAGADGRPPLALKQAALELGVLTADLDRALWNGLGRR